MEIGDTFLLVDRRIDEHLWIVISMPQNNENIVIVSLTTHTALKDQSCLLEVGDHPWIRHKTCVSYRDARVVTEALLDQLVATTKLIPRGSASDALLEKILAGAERSDELPNKCLTILVDQGLIEL